MLEGSCRVLACLLAASTNTQPAIHLSCRFEFSVRCRSPTLRSDISSFHGICPLLSTFLHRCYRLWRGCFFGGHACFSFEGLAVQGDYRGGEATCEMYIRVRKLHSHGLKVCKLGCIGVCCCRREVYWVTSEVGDLYQGFVPEGFTTRDNNTLL